MFTRCPGQDNMQVRLELLKCPNCSAEIEMLSSEIKVKCSQCGQIVYRESVPTCIEWCAAARECLGEERWRQLKSNT